MATETTSFTTATATENTTKATKITAFTAAKATEDTKMAIKTTAFTAAIEWRRQRLR